MLQELAARKQAQNEGNSGDEVDEIIKYPLNPVELLAPASDRGLEMDGDSGEVYGLDISESMLKITTSRIEEEGLSHRVNLQCGDAANFPYTDGFIDGVVYQDKLGIDKIFFQAKRYDENNAVSASMIRDFVGALELNGVNKGVFITTSKFPKDSEDLVYRSHKNIKLVDGRYLVQLMIDYDLGVDTEKIYKIKRIDYDFFPEE